MMKRKDNGHKTIGVVFCKARYYLRFISLLILAVTVFYGVVIMADNSYPDPDRLPQIRELPNPFVFRDGTPLKSRSEWGARREEIADYAQHYEYGRLPNESTAINAQLDGKTLKIKVTVNGKEVLFKATVSLPDNDAQSLPVFVNTGFLDENIYLSRGYALARFSPNDIAGDGGTRSGIFYQLYPNTDTGVLMAWAWGYHRVIDALLAAVPKINPEQIIVTGHSRYGKAALLAGAFDSRIAITIPASSGLAGMGNYRFRYGGGENINNIFAGAPWWFTPVLGEFVGQPERLPIDAHEVAALVAPRALLVTQGTGDTATGPQAACLSYLAARMAWKFLGVKDRIGIACRPGDHGMTRDDFQNMVDFADRQFKRANVTTDFTKVPFCFFNLKQAIPWSAPTSTVSTLKL